MWPNAIWARAVDAGSAAVVDDERVGVAVPGVSDERDRDFVLGRDLLDAAHQRRQRRQRNTDVLQQQVAQPLQRREGRPAGGHERVALVWIVGAEHLGRAVRDGRRLHERDLDGRRLARGVRADDEQRLGLTVEAHRQ